MNFSISPPLPPLTWQVMSAADSSKLDEDAAKHFCVVCGQSESHIASPLVRAQTLSEWLESALEKTSKKPLPKFCVDSRNVFSIPQNGPAVFLKTWLEGAKMGKQWIYARDDVREAEADEVAKFTYSGDILPGVGSGHQENAGYINQVYNFFPPTVAPATLHHATFPPRAGSVCAHEFCAERLHEARRAQFQRQKNLDLHRIEETFESVGRGKTPCIGKDRMGGRYWVFVGAPYLFVSRPPDKSDESSGVYGGLGGNGHTVSPIAAKMPLAASISSATLLTYAQIKAFVPEQWIKASAQHMYGGSSAVNVTDKQVSEFWEAYGNLPDPCPEGLGGLQWSIYRTSEEIGRVMQWLDNDDLDERPLRLSIGLLFPAAEAASAAERRARQVAVVAGLLVPASVSAPNVDDDNEANEGRPSAVPLAAAAEEESDEDLQDTASEEEDEEDEDEDEDAIDAGLGRPRRERRHKRGGDRTRPGPKRHPATANLLPPEQWQSLAAQPLLLNQKVLVFNERNGVYWDAAVLDVRTPVKSVVGTRDPLTGILHPAPTSGSGGGGGGTNPIPGPGLLPATAAAQVVKVRFTEWGEGYDAWFPRKHVLPLRGTEARHLRDKSRRKYRQTVVATAPDPICHMRAWTALQDLDPQTPRPPVYYSDATSDNPLGMLRAAMLTLESAVPPQALEVKRDGQWGSDFVLAWRDAVIQAADAVVLMNCMLLLEVGIKPAWIRPGGAKLLACMPNKFISIRRATVGLVATRLFALDTAIAYDKREQPSGRPSKATKSHEDKHTPLPAQAHCMVLLRSDKAVKQLGRPGGHRAITLAGAPKRAYVRRVPLKKREPKEPQPKEPQPEPVVA